MISTEEALRHLFALTSRLEHEDVPLSGAGGRVLARDMVATRTQPPFAASAMDGYAVRHADCRRGGALHLVGEAAAGQRFAGVLKSCETVRIFTGAPLPNGADTVVIQEDTDRTSNGVILNDIPAQGSHVRPAGGDFTVGTTLPAPRLLGPSDVALAAAMNLPRLTVARRPEIAIIATGNELVQPGEVPTEDQIIASNALGLRALFEQAGAIARVLPIARDTHESLRTVLDLALPADLIVTIGGASVGDHDLVGSVADAMGLHRAFYKVAMRPGKPLMAGTLGDTPMVGLPGNPVSAMVCGHIFILPMIAAMQGLPARARPRETAQLGTDLPPNSLREHYMRATVAGGRIVPFARQDSSLLHVLSQSNALLVRPPHDPARGTGDTVEMIPLRAMTTFD
ncbi:MAG: gephyrin-like molybdotransferase Glp [Pseudomonadota bacterium]